MLQIQANKPNIGFKSKRLSHGENKQLDRPSTQATTTGILAGATASMNFVKLARFSINKSFKPVLEKKLMPFPGEKAASLAKQMIEENKLVDRKSVGFALVNDKNADRIAEKIFLNYPDKPINKLRSKLSRLLRKRVVDSRQKALNTVDVVCNGKNAFYIPKMKLALAPESKALLILHEVGHAVNCKNAVVKNLLQVSRHVPGIAFPVLMFTSLVHKKQENNENKSLVTKGLDFVKDQAAGLTFLSFVPMLFDEALASGRALKFAKGKLKKSVFNNLAKNYTAAFLTYLGAAVATSLAVKFAAFAKDKIENSKILNKNKKENENVIKESALANIKYGFFLTGVLLGNKFIFGNPKKMLNTSKHLFKSITVQTKKIIKHPEILTNKAIKNNLLKFSLIPLVTISTMASGFAINGAIIGLFLRSQKKQEQRAVQ